MTINRTVPWLLLGIGLLTDVPSVNAGMPATLPTNWTRENTPEWISKPSLITSGLSKRETWQAISFFSATVLISAWIVKQLWRSLRFNLTWLPELHYWQSLSFVLLWGLLFIIVLTMISGARELMTPGAWRKQGWTYKLASDSRPADNSVTPRTERRRALEKLQAELWRYAATHHGQFPDKNSPDIDSTLWKLPGWPGLSFLIVPNRTANHHGQLLVFEPEVDLEERHVLLTNGLIGTMRTADIRNALGVNDHEE